MELLVVIAVIAVLVLMLLPAINAAREAARRTRCINNMKQIGLAVNNFEVATGRYPSSWNRKGGWSIHGRLLPFLEEKMIHDNIEFEVPYANAVPITGEKLSSLCIGSYQCPTEPNSVVRLKSGTPAHYPVNYGMNLGIWFVWDPATDEGGLGPFYPESELFQRHIADGLSKTLCAAEVKAYTPYIRNVSESGDLTAPLTADDLPPGGERKWGLSLSKNTGHTEWVDGRVHQTGFTTAFAPNTQVSPSGADGRDIDWTNQQEGKSDTVKTYAAVTSRSHHSQIVNVTFLDGHVQTIRDDIQLAVWQALSTRHGGEPTPAELD